MTWRDPSIVQFWGNVPITLREWVMRHAQPLVARVERTGGSCRGDKLRYTVTLRSGDVFERYTSVDVITALTALNERSH